MNWQDIQTFPNIHYRVDVPWMFLKMNLDNYINEHKLDLNPDFQRGHVWTEQQQIAYVEFMLRQPQSGREIYFNHPGWMGSFEGDFVLVDGLQRITAAQRFVNNEIPAFGHFLSDIGGLESKRPGVKKIPSDVSFSFNIAKLQTRAEVLQWYLDFNSGGTPHSIQEINRVQELLKKEKQ